MYSLFIDILFIVIVFNLLALAVMVIFFWNARINLRRQIVEKRFLIRVLGAAKTSHSSAEGADSINVPVEAFTLYCKQHGIELPEHRVEKRERAKKKKEDEERKIMEEEAEWRAEQHKVEEERRKSIENEAKERKERLKKFGFR